MPTYQFEKLGSNSLVYARISYLTCCTLMIIATPTPSHRPSCSIALGARVRLGASRFSQVRGMSTVIRLENPEALDILRGTAFVVSSSGFLRGDFGWRRKRNWLRSSQVPPRNIAPDRALPKTAPATSNGR